MMADMTLEEALAAAEVDEVVGMVDDIITIDPNTRIINVPDSEKTFGVETDKDSERKYFRCPRIVGDNIDLSQHKIYISYVSTTSNALKIFPKADGSYWCDDVAVDGDYITFSWKLSGNVFKEPGFVAFKVLAKKTDGDIEKTRWNTAPAFGTVLLTVPDGESVEERYPDIITQLLERMDAVEAIATEEAMQGYVDTYFEKNPVKPGATDEQAEQIEKNTQNIDELKQTLTNKQDKLIAGTNITISEDGKTISATGGSGGNADNIELNQLAVFHTKNLFNPDKVEYDKMAEMPGYDYLNYIEKTDEGSCLSEFMEVDHSKSYKQNAQRMVFLFDENKTLIGFRLAESFSIPSNAKYAKISVHYQPTFSNIRKSENFLFNVIIAEENDYNDVVASPYIQCDIPKNVTVVNSHRLYNISDIYTHWIAGEKFPIAFYGDSTTEGDSTTDADGNVNPVGVTNNTLGIDYVWSGAFPARLEAFMRELTGNDSIRCYNAGFSGKDTRFAWYNYKREFGDGTAYADTKMIFLGYGINDRVPTAGTSEQMSPSILYNKVYYWTEQLVRMIKLDGKQPVIMTTQPYYSYFNSSGLTRGSCESITNKALVAVANAYNLEIVDRFSSLSRMFENTKNPIGNYLHTDLLHCNDGGHKLTSDLLAQIIAPAITDITGKEKLDVSDKSYINNNIIMNATKTGRFGLEINTIVDIGLEITNCKIYTEKPVTVETVYENNYQSASKIVVNDVETDSVEVGYNVVSIVATAKERFRFMGIVINEN